MSIVSLFGQPVEEREPNENCIKTLEIALERAKAGEVVGVVIVEQHYDSAASYLFGGFVSSYSTLGALTRVTYELGTAE